MEASMPSFDAVSEADMQEMDNAVNNLKKELNSRFDFKGSNTEVDLNKKDKVVKFMTTDEMKMNILREMLISAVTKRGVDSRCLEFGETEKAGGAMLRRTIKIKEGIDKETAKKITTAIKESKMKVQASIMDEKIRIQGKKIDDLQEAIALMKTLDLPLPLQFINMKS